MRRFALWEDEAGPGCARPLANRPEARASGHSPTFRRRAVCPVRSALSVQTQGDPKIKLISQSISFSP